MASLGLPQSLASRFPNRVYHPNPPGGSAAGKAKLEQRLLFSKQLGEALLPSPIPSP